MKNMKIIKLTESDLIRIVKRVINESHSDKTNKNNPVRLDEGIMKKILPGLCAIGMAASMTSCKDNTVKYSYQINKFDRKTGEALEPRQDNIITTFLSFDHKLSPEELDDVKDKLDDKYNEELADKSKNNPDFIKQIDTSWVENYTWSRKKDF